MKDHSLILDIIIHAKTQVDLKCLGNVSECSHMLCHYALHSKWFGVELEYIIWLICTFQTHIDGTPIRVQHGTDTVAR